MHLLILVTVGGVEEFKFNRLFMIIDELCEEGVIDKKQIIVQGGYNDYIPKNYEITDFFESDEFKKLIVDSQFIISHAGTGTVVSAVKEGKKVIIFPRIAKYHEHLDDHQLELCQLFENNNFALVAHNKEELVECIKHINEFVPNKFVSNNNYITNLIISYIEQGRIS